MGEEEYKRVFGKTRDEAVEETRSELRDVMKTKDKKRIKEVYDKLKRVFIGEDVMWANEVASNITVSIVMIILSVILILTALFAKLGIYEVNVKPLVIITLLCVVQMSIGVFLCHKYKGERTWLKMMLMVMVCITIACVNTSLGIRTSIALSIPVVLSTRYLSEKFTRIISVISGLLILTSTVNYGVWGITPELNNIPIESGTVIKVAETFRETMTNQLFDKGDYIVNLLLHMALPNLFQFLVIAVICCKIAKYGHKVVLEQAEISKEFARVDTELSVANNIQTNMLPNIFPAFPDREEFDIYATMEPAKEVGGDFYDFFLIDDDHLAIVIADVSGKGVPAALFMMIGKTLIKNYAQLGLPSDKVFEHVNNQLCENNEEGLFITAWLGILEISTGIVKACNAGHEYPIIKRENGEYELFKDKHGFILAGMENIKYTEYEFKLEKNDSLFVYTDGVTEATDKDNRLFGTERMICSLNNNSKDAQEDILVNLRKSIDEFVGEAPQFDDITMLGLKYLGDK